MKAPTPSGNIKDTRFAEALGERYLTYALSTIVSRSLPDVRDGLKPVHRRLLFAMRQLKLDHTSGFKKCARVVGDVIGKYHPHGDVAVYDAMVRLAQEFAVRYPLVEGQGNFGNIDGDNAAAMRYTEARMTAVAQALLDGIDEDAVDFRETYDGEESEPVVLPSRFPNLLANGSAGIAVGMATNIPPHNAGELCKALIHLIDHPETEVADLVHFVPGPDFPTGGILVEGRESILDAYTTGRGGFRLRARWHVEKLPRGLFQVVVTEIPYQVQKSRLIEKTADLLLARKLPLLADIRDESTDEVRIILEPRNRTVDPDLMMEHLFRLSDLETRFGLNMNVLDASNTPKVMNLKDVLSAFLAHRHEVLVRRSKFRLGKIDHRLEVLGALMIVYLNLDEVIRIIREEDDAKASLVKAFEISDMQAESILNTRLRSLRKLEEKEIRKEKTALEKERGGLNTLLGDATLRWKSIRAETLDIDSKFGGDDVLGKRRTDITDAPVVADVPLESMIEREPITILCSDKGWIRAAKGHLAETADVRYKEGDKARFAIHAQTTDKLLVFGTNGRFYTIGCDKLPGGRGLGEPLRLMIDLGEGHEVQTMMIHQPDSQLIVASDAGRGFRIAENDVIAQTKNGKQILNVSGDEEATICIRIDAEANAVAVVGQNRRMLVFALDELPSMARGRGVILQRYKQGGLSDLKTFELGEGLSWKMGERTRTEKDLTPWTAKRGHAGRMPPTGFPRSNRFT